MNGVRTAGTATMLSLAATCAFAAEPRSTANDPVLAPVEVNALRDPVEKSYRKIMRGMDLFEQRHSVAPNASLRFKLLPRSRETNMQGITLTIVSERVEIPVPVAPDNTFTLPRDARALTEDAVVAPNRKAR